MNETSFTDVFFSVERALTGAATTSNLRAVTVEHGRDFIFLYFYFDKQPSEFEEELAEVSLTEVICDFSLTDTISFEAKKIHLPYPQKIPKKGFLAFYRYEPESKVENQNPSLEFDYGKKDLSHLNILLSTQRALLGCVTANLRYVRAEYGEDFIFLFFYYDREPSELEIRLADQVGEKVSSNFSNAKNFNINKSYFPYPQRIPEVGIWIFHRYEPILQEMN